MHRIVALLLITLYLPAALNVTVTAHYCMGKLTGVDVAASAPANNTCSQCSMVKKDQKGCCHDKQETLKLSKDQFFVPATVIAAPLTAILQSHYFPLSYILFARGAIDLPTAHSPPLIKVSPLLLHCVFRI